MVQPKLFIIIFLYGLFLSNSFAQDTLIFRKDYLPYPDTVLVFSPEKVKETSPLIFLLHGYTGNYKNWNDHSDIQKLANDFGFTIVCPDGYYDSWYINNNRNSKMQYEKFFFNDLFPKILNDYLIDTSNIFITGLSMGGHGAISLFLKNREKFKAAGSMSGILDISEFPDRWSLTNALGSYWENKEFWDSNNSYNLVDLMIDCKKPLYIDCGYNDFAFYVNRKFVDKCRALGINIYFNERQGNHSWNFWIESLKYHLYFFKNQLEIKYY